MTRDEFLEKWEPRGWAACVHVLLLRDLDTLIAAAREEQREVDRVFCCNNISGRFGDYMRDAPLTATPLVDEIARLKERIVAEVGAERLAAIEFVEEVVHPSPDHTWKMINSILNSVARNLRRGDHRK